MKTRIWGIMTLCCALGLGGCLNEDTPEDKVEVVNMEISSQTCVYAPVLSEIPQEGMWVRIGDDTRYQDLGFGEINGFTYERGYAYQLRVERTTLANPPADAGIYTYRLLEERTRKPAEAVRETVILEVDAQPGNYEWGIPGMEEAPCMKIREEGEEAWTNVPFNKIEGFAYTKDWSYKLSVEKITLEEKPDGEQCQTVQYVLKEILSKSAPLGN